MTAAADAHARDMGAAQYWSRFTATVRFDEPCEVTGTVAALQDHVLVDGSRCPKIKLDLDDGSSVWVIAAQTRLLSELVRRQPRRGDRLRITYLGQPKGGVAAKEFKVAVHRPQPGEVKP